MLGPLTTTATTTTTTPPHLASRRIAPRDAMVDTAERSIRDGLPGRFLIDRHRRRVVDPAIRRLVDELQRGLARVAFADAVARVDDVVRAQVEGVVVVFAERGRIVVVWGVVVGDFEGQLDAVEGVGPCEARRLVVRIFRLRKLGVQDLQG